MSEYNPTLCPFCGQMHRTEAIPTIVGMSESGAMLYGEIEGGMIILSCCGGIAIPADIYAQRPLEGLLLEEIDRLKGV